MQQQARALGVTQELMPEAAAALERLQQHCVAAGRPFYAISAATGLGLTELLRAVAAQLEAAGWARAVS